MTDPSSSSSPPAGQSQGIYPRLSPCLLTTDHSMAQSVNGSGSSNLSPAQLRQLEADSHPDLTPSNPQHPRSSAPPNLLSEENFPSLGTPSKATPAKPVATSWGAKRSPAPTSPNGVNGRGATSSTTPSPAPAPVRGSLANVIPGSKNLSSQLVTELVRFHKQQLQNPNAKDFVSICDRITKYSGVEKIGVSRMKVSEVVTFSITGKPENVIKARNRLQNEVGIKVFSFLTWVNE
jgi:hypothetical protein